MGSSFFIFFFFCVLCVVHLQRERPRETEREVFLKRASFFSEGGRGASEKKKQKKKRQKYMVIPYQDI